MDLLLKITLTACLYGLAACTFLPGIDEEQSYESESCQLVTQELDLKTYLGFEEVDLFDSDNDKTPEAKNNDKPKSSKSSSFGGNNSPGAIVIAAMVAWGASTLIVSGSIVVSGNIVHWSEYQGRCDESELRQFVYQF